MPYDTFFGINLVKFCTLGTRLGGLFFDPNTGDDMVDKDDLFQEEDGITPQKQDQDDPSSNEDDDIIDLFDTVEMPAEDTEEDVIELEDVVEVPDDEIIELTEEILEPVEDDDVLELTDIADTDDIKGSGLDVDGDFIDLTEPVAQEEVFDLLDTVELPAQDMTEDILEPEHTAQVTDTDHDTLGASETEDEEDVFDFLDTIEIPDQDIPADIHELTGTHREIDTDLGDDILDSAEALALDDIDETMDLSETPDPMDADPEEHVEDTVALPKAGYEEDKELLELIDDIQATLNDEPAATHAGDQEAANLVEEAIDGNTREDDDDKYTFMDDDEFLEDRDSTESETEFADHLGIDLTSEIERKTLEESQEAAMEEVKPTERVEPDIPRGALETAVKQALTEMLADENNPLAKAIENAVRKALGQGADT